MNIVGNHTIKMFIKFGEQRHMEDLLHNSSIYINPIQYFRKIEDNALRGDSYEGISAIKHYPEGEFEIPAINYKGSYLAFQIRQSYEPVFGNIFSLYCISSKSWGNPNEFRINKKTKNLDHIVL